MPGRRKQWWNSFGFETKFKIAGRDRVDIYRLLSGHRNRRKSTRPDNPGETKKLRNRRFCHLRRNFHPNTKRLKHPLTTKTNRT